MKLLGHTVRDRLTGFKGVAAGYVVYITGCNQYLLTPPVNDKGERQEGAWFDEQRLEIIPGTVRIIFDNVQSPGAGEPPPDR